MQTNMTPRQIKNKISDLEFWLKSNPNHYLFAKNYAQKKELERQLLEKRNEF